MTDDAHAASARIRFHVEPKPYSEAVLDIAQQANVTLIGAGACTGASSRRLVGGMSLEAALATLLADAPCVATLVAPGAVEVSRRGRAETTAAEPPIIVSELLVTATKRVRNPRQLAVAVTAAPAAELKAIGASDASDAVGQLTGVAATNLGPGRNKLLLRGLSDGAYTGRTRSIVATYLDDLPINYNAPDPDLRLVDVERVEVARGPQGALYGSGSLSGVYRIVTRKPNLQRYAAELRVSGALTEQGSPSHALEGYVNIPVWDQIAGVRLSAYDEVQGGYIDDIRQDRKDVDKTGRRGARLSILVQPNDAWTVNVTLAGQHLRSDDTHYTAPSLGLTRAVRIPEPHVNDIESLAVTVKRSWGWGELTSSTGFVRHAYASLYDATATQQLYTSFAETSSYSERNRTKMLVEDLVLTSRGSGPLEWLVGVYGSDTMEYSPTQLLAKFEFSPNVPVYFDERRDRIRELAAYGEVAYAFTPRWTLALGGRAFSIHARTTSRVESERFVPRNIDRTGDYSGFSPKLSLQWNFAGADLIYAVLSEGYRAGGVNSGGAQPLSAARATFAPDRLRNYEIGLKLQGLSQRLSLNSAVFYDVWSNIQTDQFRPSGIPYTTNAGDAHILGLENELSLDIGAGLFAQLNVSLSRTRMTNPNPDFAARLANSLPGAPSVSGGGLISYERQIPGDWKLRLVGQATYVGRSRVAFDARRASMGGYTRARLSAEISRSTYGVQVFVSNPTNAYSDTFAFGNPFNPGQLRQITPQRPRTIGVTLFAGI